MIPHNHRMSEFSIFLWWGLRASSFMCLVRKSCQRHLCLPFRSYEDQWSTPFWLLLHVPRGKAQEWGQFLSDRFTECNHFWKTPLTCLPTSDLCFPTEVWFVGLQAVGLNPGPCASWQVLYNWEASPTWFTSLKCSSVCCPELYFLPWLPCSLLCDTEPLPDRSPS